LSRSERVLGALAIALAEGMDASPPYAKGKLARELREVLVELRNAEVSGANLACSRAWSYERCGREASGQGIRLP
jgi:hypothetical protein